MFAEVTRVSEALICHSMFISHVLDDTNNSLGSCQFISLDVSFNCSFTDVQPGK